MLNFLKERFEQEIHLTNIQLPHTNIWVMKRKQSKLFNMLQHGFLLSSSRFGGLSKESQTDTKALIDTGQLQLREGIYYTLAKIDPQKAKQLFEWAAENCNQSDEDVF